jgi:hypothetical protein
MGGYSQINLEPEEPRNIAESDKRTDTITHTGAEWYCQLRCLFQEVVQDQTSGVLRWSMSLAYRIVFECPHGPHNINLQKKCGNVSLSEAEAMKMFANEDLSCTNPNCGWRGKASKTRVLRILPFNWIFSPS